jgi:hypothetical protein
MDKLINQIVVGFNFWSTVGAVSRGKGSGSFLELDLLLLFGFPCCNCELKDTVSC